MKWIIEKNVTVTETVTEFQGPLKILNNDYALTVLFMIFLFMLGVVLYLAIIFNGRLE